MSSKISHVFLDSQLSHDVSHFIISCRGPSRAIYCRGSYMRSATLLWGPWLGHLSPALPLPPLGSTCLPDTTTSRGHHSHCLTPSTSSGIPPLHLCPCQSASLPPSPQGSMLYAVACGWCHWDAKVTGCSGVRRTLQPAVLSLHWVTWVWMKNCLCPGFSRELIKWLILFKPRAPLFPECICTDWELGSGQN